MINKKTFFLNFFLSAIISTNTPAICSDEETPQLKKVLFCSELASQIFSYLPPSDFVTVSQTCRSFLDICSNSNLAMPAYFQTSITYRAIWNELDALKYNIKVASIKKIPIELELWGFNDSDNHIEFLRKVFSITDNSEDAQSPISKIHFRESQIGFRGVELMANTPTLRNIRNLSLSANYITFEGVKLITEHENFSRLQFLDLSLNALNHRSAQLIAESKNFTGLESLNLYMNKLRNDGVQFLASSETLTTLCDLNVGFNGINNNSVGPIQA